MSRIFITISRKQGLNPRERDLFNHAVYFECDKFNYTYSSAVNNYNYAHGGSPIANNLSGYVLTEEEWNTVVTSLRNLVSDKYMHSLSVHVYYWQYDPNGVGHFESGFVFRYGTDIVAYSVWDFTNLSNTDVCRITDDGYII
jgi:hypothetical protein